MKQLRYSDEQWQMLTNANCIDVARALGFEFDEKKSDKKALHVKDKGGLFIWRDGTGWYNFSEESKGRAIDLVENELHLNHRGALDWINRYVLGGKFEKDETVANSDWKAEIKKEAEPKEFKMPNKTKPSNAYAYLIHSRQISKEIVATLFNKGSIIQDDRNNCGFCGFDKHGNVKYCALRGTSTFGENKFRGEVAGSQKKYGFAIMGTSKVLKVFESPIDAMSHATLASMWGGNWQEDTRLSLGGVGSKALEQHLADYPGYEKIWLCLDNDEAGQEASERMRKQFGDRYEIKISRPHNKDFNEDLIEANELMEETGCQFTDVCKYWKTGERPPEQLQLQRLCR